VQHRVAGGRGVLHEGQVVRTRADKVGKPCRCCPQRRRQLLAHEVRRVALHQRAPAFLLGEHRARRRAERAVVEERDLRIE
jgi:hypothetical protein